MEGYRKFTQCKNWILFYKVRGILKIGILKILISNNFYVNKVVKDLANKDRCIISTKI